MYPSNISSAKIIGRAINFVRHNTDMRRVQMLLSHSSLNVTPVYLQFKERDLKAVLRRCALLSYLVYQQRMSARIQLGINISRGQREKHGRNGVSVSGASVIATRFADKMTDKWDAADYHEHSSAQYAFAVGLIERLQFDGDEHVLDIGCGNGKVTAELSALVPRGSVLGIDTSPDMLAFAREAFPPSAYPNLLFQYGDAARLSFCHEFDVVVAFSSLHWVEDLPAAMRGIRRSLVPGGLFAAQLLAKRHITAETKSPLRRARKEVMNRLEWRRYFEGFTQRKVYSADEVERLLRDTGFIVSRCEFVTEKIPHLDAEALKGYARSTWHPYTDCIPASKRDAFLDEVVQRGIELALLDRSKGIRVRSSLLEVNATAAFP